MTLRHFKIFISVVDLGSMTAASKSLFVSQPTVSQAISELEKYYGVKLFDRISRHLYLTEAGKQLLSYARHITSLYDEMEKRIKNTDTNGIIKIGASVTVGTYFLPKIISDFKNIYPHLRINVIVKNTEDIENLITKNEIDFGIVEGTVHNSDIISEGFMEDELVLACGKCHALYNAVEILTSDLHKLNFIVREQGSGTRELFESIMSTYNIPWELVWECNNFESIKEGAINGHGIAVLPKVLIENEVKMGDLRIISAGDIILKRDFKIIFHKNKYLTKIMKSFFELCNNL